MNLLPPGRCACHEPTVKWCGRHGKPLKLLPGDRVMREEELFFLRECLDRDKAEALAAEIRVIARANA